MLSFRQANRKRKKKSQNANPGHAMPKPELFCLKEMLVSVCQMNIHLWDAPENAQTDSAGDARGAEKILKEYLPFPPPHVRVKEKERKEQPKSILCESVAEKDADSVKDSGFRRA